MSSRCPHAEQVFDDGNQRSATTKRVPARARAQDTARGDMVSKALRLLVLVLEEALGGMTLSELVRQAGYP